MPKQKVKLLFKDSYLRFIENSLGANCFRSLLAEVDGKKQDILKDGQISAPILSPAFCVFLD